MDPSALVYLVDGERVPLGAVGAALDPGSGFRLTSGEATW